MARYKERKDEDGVLIGVVVNDTNHPDQVDQKLGVFVPEQSGSRHWEGYLTWAAIEGNTVDPADVVDYEPRMKTLRDQKIQDTVNTILRNDRQVRQGMDNATRSAADDAVSDSQLVTLDSYVEELANLPGLITSEGEVGGAGSFETPTWPSKPSFVP